MMKGRERDVAGDGGGDEVFLENSDSPIFFERECSNLFGSGKDELMVEVYEDI